MKKKLLFFIMVLLTFGMSAESKNAYGILITDGEDVYDVGALVSFPLEGNVTDFTSEVKFGMYDANSGAYADGFYYVETASQATGVWKTDKLLKVNLETKEYTEVGTLAGFNNIINDMTFDNRSKVMYAIARVDNTISALYTIDLATANVEKKFDLDRRFFTLACTYDGQLYAISFAGELCKINSSTGEVTVVGSTGLDVQMSQSMEFDHSTGTLYWIAGVRTISGAMQIDETYMATIDTATAAVTRLGNVGTDSQVLGLYIPFVATLSGAPAAVSDFTVTPDAAGDLQVTVAWRNPSSTFGGSQLTGKLKVELYRNGELIKTYDDMQPGVTMKYSESIETDAAGLSVTYKVVTSNSEGEGIPVEGQAFVGKDTPAAPANLTLARDGYDNAVISWEAPTAGLNGGYLDASKTTYKVVRMPDNKVVTESTKESTIRDAGISPVGNYSYEVTSVGEVGEGGKATTETMTFGPLNTLPYSCNFSDENVMASWSIVDHNGDGDTWIRQGIWDGSTGMAYMSEKNDADDYLISHPFTFEAGINYDVTLNVMAYGQTSYEIVLLKDGNVEAPIQSLQQFTEFEKVWEKIDQSFSFKVQESGVYNFAIKSTAKRRDGWLYVFSLGIEEGASTNLAATAIKGSSKPQLEKAATYTITVSNTGTKQVAAYTVNLKDATTGTILATKEITEPIEPKTTSDIELEWTPASKDVTALVGEVACDGDIRESDNTTAELAVTVADPDPDNLVRIGSSWTGQTKEAPFDFYDNAGATLNIYAQSEIARESGSIFKISYPYANNAAKSDLAVKVYLANTELATTEAGWIPENELTLVFDGKVSVDETEDGELEVAFDKAFDYTGKNLAILTVSSAWNTVYNCFFKTYKSPLDGNNCLKWYSNTANFNFSVAGTQTDFNNSVNIYINPQGGVDALGVTTAKVYPNPASDHIKVDGEVALIELLDLGGRKVAETNASQINVQGISDGLYLLIATDANNNRKIAKVKIAH